MWGAATFDIIHRFSNDRASIVSTFCATEFDFEEVNWLFESWNAINRKAGMHWHILVPTTKEISGGAERVTGAEYNFSLAQEIIDIYGISDKNLPALIFDNFVEEERQAYLTIPRDPRDARAMFLRVAELIRYECRGPDGVGLGQHRIDTINRVVTRIHGEAALKQMLAFAPKAAGPLIKMGFA